MPVGNLGNITKIWHLRLRVIYTSGAESFLVIRLWCQIFV